MTVRLITAEDLLKPMKHISVSDIRQLNKKTLRSLGGLNVIHHGAEPVAVIFPYNAFMCLQTIYQEAVEQLGKQEESNG